MAKLYEIEQAILDCVDMETGEILDIEKLEDLQLERKEKIESVACWYKNLISDAKAIKEEREVLEQRQRALENKAKSIKDWLSYKLAGEKLTTPRVAISFRRSAMMSLSFSIVQCPLSGL